MRPCTAWSALRWRHPHPGHRRRLGNVCEILEDEDALEQLKTTSDLNYVLEHLQ